MGILIQKLGLFGFAPLIFRIKLALIGFVLGLNWVCFLIWPNAHFSHIYLSQKSLAKFTKLDFGFVLHNKG